MLIKQASFHIKLILFPYSIGGINITNEIDFVGHIISADRNMVLHRKIGTNF